MEPPNSDIRARFTVIGIIHQMMNAEGELHAPAAATAALIRLIEIEEKMLHEAKLLIMELKDMLARVDAAGADRGPEGPP